MTEVSQATPDVAPAKKKFNRADYKFMSKTGETLVKVPGKIDGKAFVIGMLEDCKVYLYDHSAQVSGILPSRNHLLSLEHFLLHLSRIYQFCRAFLQITIDKCKNCTFVIGPIKGSIFLRDCENCIVHVAC